MRVTHLAAISLLALAGCGDADNSIHNLSESPGDDESDVIELAVVEKVDPVVAQFYEALSQQKPVPVDTYTAVAPKLGGMASRVVRYIDKDKEIDEFSGPSYIQYQGLQLQEKVLVFQRKDSMLHPFAIFPSSLYTHDEQGYIASVEDKITHYLDTKIYDAHQTKALFSAANQLEVIASFIPGFIGSQRIAEGSSQSEKIIGAVEVLGDAATLGLTVKVKVVTKGVRKIKQGLAEIVLVASTVRIYESASKFANGNRQHG